MEPASAILGIVNERAIPMNANHRELVRFSHTEPEKYRPLKNRLRDLVDKIEGGAQDHGYDCNQLTCCQTPWTIHYEGNI